MSDEVRSGLQTFKYPGPRAQGDVVRTTKTKTPVISFRMINNDICVSTVQVIFEKGGGATLHYHNDEDGYWLVLGGRAQFFDASGQIVAELGKHEGIFIPRSTRYAFESSDDTAPLEILRVSHHSSKKDDHTQPEGSLGED